MLTFVQGKIISFEKKKKLERDFFTENQEVYVLENTELNNDGINLVGQDAQNACWKRNFLNIKWRFYQLVHKSEPLTLFIMEIPII